MMMSTHASRIRRLSTRAVVPLLFVIFAAACGGGGGGDGGGAGGTGSKCSNVLGQQCGAGEYCNFTDLSCGETGLEGRCELIPVAACVGPTISQEAPVCTCAGITFDNECWASSAGQSVRAPGLCP